MIIDDKKRFILDSNVLLYDPESIFSYPDAHVIIPISVIEEIDHFKKDITQTGRNARIVCQLLDQLRQKGSLTKGVELPKGGLLSVLIPKSGDAQLPKFLDIHLSSNKVLAAALSVHNKFQGLTYLVTNNMNLRIRVAALGIKTTSFEDEIINLKQLYAGIQNIDLTNKKFSKFLKQGFLDAGPDLYYPNQHVVLRCETSEEQVACRFFSDKQQLRPIRLFPKGVWGIRPRNLEQEAALDLLMDPSVHVVILAGKAGTGKTMLALAAALEQMLSTKLYTKVLVSRPIFPMGRDMGYLPGDLEEKLAPWMQPIFDNLDFLISNQRSGAHRAGNYQKLLDKGLVELEPLTYIRGRSIPNRFMIVDEAQNLTPHELKTIVTRVGEGTKLILTGDPFQIDNPYVDPSSNAISYIIEKFRNHSIAGHANLIYGVRSKLAELAANVL